MANDSLMANAIRALAMDAVQQANSGHPGAPMGMAPVAHVLFNKFMTFNPKNPEWVNRDRFVLSYVVLFPILHSSIQQANGQEEQSRLVAMRCVARRGLT